MNPIQKFLSECGIKELGDNGFSGYVSTKELDRDNEIILPHAFNKSIKQYMKNPVIFAAHQRVGLNGEPTIIAKCTSLKADDIGLRFTAEYAPTELAQEWKKLIEGGFVSGISHRYLAKKWQDSRSPEGSFIRTYSEAELLEISVEPLQANRGALIDAKGKGFDAKLIDSLVKGLDDRDTFEKQVQLANEKTMRALGVVANQLDDIKTLLKGAATKEELETKLFEIMGDVLDPDGAYAKRLSNPESMGTPDHEEPGSTEEGESLRAIGESLKQLTDKLNTVVARSE